MSGDTDHVTQLAEQRTRFAVQRTFLAFERSLMAWLRTSLSMISFGFTLVKFFEYLQEQRGARVVGRFGVTWASDTVGMSMIGIGTVALALAVVRHKKRVDTLRAQGLAVHWNLVLIVAGLVAVLGALAFLSLLVV